MCNHKYMYMYMCTHAQHMFDLMSLSDDQTLCPLFMSSGSSVYKPSFVQIVNTLQCKALQVSSSSNSGTHMLMSCVKTRL